MEKPRTWPRPKRPRLRSAITCPFCGLRYERFRCGLPTFADVKAQMILEAKAHASEGRYNLTARLSAVLGRLHGLKKRAWEDEHVEWCRREWEATGQSADPPRSD